MKLIKCHNLFLVRSDELGTVFQSHDRREAEAYIRGGTKLHTFDMKISMEQSAPVKYGRTCKY